MVFRVLGNIEDIIDHFIENDSILPSIGKKTGIRNLAVPGSFKSFPKDYKLWISKTPLENWHNIYSKEGFSVVPVIGGSPVYLKRLKKMWVNDAQVALPEDYFKPIHAEWHNLDRSLLPPVYRLSFDSITEYIRKRGKSEEERASADIISRGKYFPLDIIPYVQACSPIPKQVLFSGDSFMSIPPDSSEVSLPPEDYSHIFQ